MSIVLTVSGVKEYFENKKLENYDVTVAVVTKVGTVGHSTYVTYKYHVLGLSYENEQVVNHSSVRSYSDEELEIIKNLKIKYSIEAPWISKIIDDRVKYTYW